MNQMYTYLALDIAHERAQQARESRLAASVTAGQPERPSILRRGLAHGLAAVSRGSAAAARRLDAATSPNRSVDQF
jgi:hypothetical protein